MRLSIFANDGATGSDISTEISVAANENWRSAVEDWASEHRLQTWAKPTIVRVIADGTTMLYDRARGDPEWLLSVPDRG